MIFMEQIFPWNNDMYMVFMEQICSNNYMGLSLPNLNVKEQVYSYRNRTSLVCTLSGTDKTSLHQCQLIM